MVDHWLGHVFDQLDARRLWDATLVVVTTDHGHYLGDKGLMGKPDGLVYDVLAHTPVFIWDPAGRCKGERVSALTRAIDLYLTLLEALGCEPPTGTHGRSLLPLLRGETTFHSAWALYGIFGRAINITDGRYLPAGTSAIGGSSPLHILSAHAQSLAVRAGHISRLPRVGPLPAYADGVCGRYPEVVTLASQVDDLLFDVEQDPG